MSSEEPIEDPLTKIELSPKGEEVELETRTSLLNVFNWSMYDLANTIYSMVIVSLIIKKYLYIILQLEHGTSYYWAGIIIPTVFMVMQVIVAISVPIIGAFSDNVGRRKPFVIYLTIIIVIFAGLLGIYQHFALVFIFFLIANLAYQFSLTFYDAMLPFIASPKDAGKVGGFGVAFGYLGTIISLPIMLVLQNNYGNSNSDPTQGVVEYGYTNKWFTFAIAMGLFLVFAIPFLFVKEKQKEAERPPFGTLIKNSFKQIGNTFRKIRESKEMFKFVIGYFLVVDVANIIVSYMLLLVTDGLLMEESFGTLFIIISTVSAVIFTYFIGMFANKFGAKKAFYLVGSLWGGAIILGILGITIWADPVNRISPGFNAPFILVLLMGLLSGPALGGTWVAQRKMIIELAPKEKFGEYFGFAKLSGKINSVAGEGLWALVWLAYPLFKAMGNPHYTFALEIGVMGVVMAIGILIIAFVKPSNSILKDIELREKIEDEEKFNEGLV